MFNLLNTYCTDFETPPFPRINAVFLYFIKGKILFSKPIISVLNPYNLLSTILTTFTDPTIYMEKN